VVKGRLHSAADASPAAALLLLQIQPGILSRRALPAGRLGALAATPAVHHGLLAAGNPAEHADDVIDD
jgi:hypothetical protein